MTELFQELLVEEADEELGWQERALCAQTDPESFFPEKGGSTREARKSASPVRSAPSALNTRSPMTSASASGAVCPSANGAAEEGRRLTIVTAAATPRRAASHGPPPYHANSPYPPIANPPPPVP